jgi:hypothetical protein
METTVTIPSLQKTQTIHEFRFHPGKLSAIVILNDNGERKDVEVDFQALVDAATATQKTTLKLFFKRIGASALDKYNEDSGVDVTENDVTGDIFA